LRAYFPSATAALCSSQSTLVPAHSDCTPIQTPINGIGRPPRRRPPASTSLPQRRRSAAANQLAFKTQSTCIKKSMNLHSNPNQFAFKSQSTCIPKPINCIACPLHSKINQVHCMPVESRNPGVRCREFMAHIRQPRSDAGRGIQVKLPQTLFRCSLFAS